MIKANRCSQTNLSRTNTTTGLHHKAFASVDIFRKGCIMRIKQRHIKWFKRAA
jgi:hypothetical protein